MFWLVFLIQVADMAKGLQWQAYPSCFKVGYAFQRDQDQEEQQQQDEEGVEQVSLLAERMAD